MADESTTSYADLLYELRGPLQELFPKQYVLSAELKRDTSEENFSGNQVRVPLILNTLQGAGAVSESGTVNTTQVLRTNQAHINIAELVMPISITKRLNKVSLDNSAAKAFALKVKEARQALARVENEMMNGNGDALLAQVSGGTSPGLTINVTAAPTRWLYPGRIIDVRTRSTGADPGQGLKRRIDSVTKTSGVVTSITLNTGSFGGGTGNVTFSTNEGIYIDGSYGNAIQGIQQVAATSGVFENLDKAVVAEWQGVDGRAGDTSSLALSIPMMDAAVVEYQTRSGFQMPDFWIGDPKAINKFAQGLYTQSRWAGDKGKLETGFAGVYYDDTLLIREFDHQVNAVRGITKETLQMYGFGDDLPDFDRETSPTGGMRFNRSLPVEYWLYDAVQLGALRCDGTVTLANLVQAS